MPIRIHLEDMIAQDLIPKQALNILLCHFMKRMLAEKHLGLPKIHYPILVIRHYEAFRMKNRYILISPKGKALCLLKTQIAKKPKNPV
jgi:hypothetical protein